MPRRVPKIEIGNRLVSKDNFYKHQKHDPVTGCTNWTGLKSNIGYGFIGYSEKGATPPKYRMMTVHRVALGIKLGRPVEDGKNANHTCHNMLCVNPDHLEEGTQQEKRADMTRDGRNSWGTGPKGPRFKKQNRQYKYTDEEIQWIRNSETIDIAAKYNITKNKAAHLRTLVRRGYRWLPWTKE